MNSGSGISCQCKSIEIFRRTCSCSLHAVEKKMRIGTSKAHMQCKERTSKGKKGKAANARQAAPNPWMGESVRNAYLYYLTVLFCAGARQHIYAACNMFPFYFTFPSSRVSSSCFFFLFFSSSSSSLLPLLAVTKRLVDVWLSVCIYVRTSLRTHASGKKNHATPSHTTPPPQPQPKFFHANNKRESKIARGKHFFNEMSVFLLEVLE